MAATTTKPRIEAPKWTTIPTSNLAFSCYSFASAETRQLADQARDQFDLAEQSRAECEVAIDGASGVDPMQSVDSLVERGESIRRSIITAMQVELQARKTFNEFLTKLERERMAAEPSARAAVDATRETAEQQLAAAGFDLRDAKFSDGTPDHEARAAFRLVASRGPAVADASRRVQECRNCISAIGERAMANRRAMETCEAELRQRLAAMAS